MKEPTKPTRPNKPKEPTEIVVYDGPVLKVDLGGTERHDLPSLLDQLKKKLPDGGVFDISKVKLDLDYSLSYDDYESENCIYYDEPEKITYVDKKYKQKYAKYLQKLEKYKDALKEFEIKSAQYVLDMAAYKEWVKNKEIEDAKKVLEKYNVS